MYHYYACGTYLAIKMYQYSGVFEYIGGAYSWIGWVFKSKTVIKNDPSYLDWVLLLEDDNSAFQLPS
jgi:hypothetical protein